MLLLQRASSRLELPLMFVARDKVSTSARPLDAANAGLSLIPAKQAWIQSLDLPRKTVLGKVGVRYQLDSLLP